MNELVSVIVPVYNVEKYLEACIISICKQTYQNLEIILVDDGSKDGSGELCDKYAELDKRITVIHRENGGLSAARNSGINNALGKYIVFVDSDDMIHERMIEILYQNLKTHDADISICSHKLIDEDVFCENIKNEKLMRPTENIYTGRECIKKFYDKDFSVDMVIMCNKLYRKEMFDILRFPEGRIQEDEYVNYQILYPVKKCFYTNLQLYYYRQRSGSIMNDVKVGRRFEQHFLCIVEYYQERIRFFYEKKDSELYGIVSLTLQRILINYYVRIRENFPEEKQMIYTIGKIHFRNFKDNIIKNKKISLSDKMRGLIFALSKNLYTRLRDLKGEKSV